MQELQNMMIFAKVLEAGSFSKAAEQLGIAKSSVSKKVSELERELGVRLLQRSTRKLRVTEEGEALYQHCRTIRSEYEQAKQALNLYSEVPQGQLRISVSPLFGNTIIAALIPGFQQLHPAVTIELHYSDQQTDLIGEGYDLSLRMGVLADSSLVAIELFTVKSILCAAPDYLDRFGCPEQPADLEKHHYLRWMAPNRPPYNRLTLYRGEDQWTSKLSCTFSSNDAQATRTVAIAGGGITLLPNYAIYQELKQGQLQALLTEYRVHEFPVSLIYPARKQVSPKVRAFVDYLKQCLKEQGLGDLQ